MKAEELLAEARSAAAAAGLTDDRHAHPDDLRFSYRETVASIAEGLRVTARDDRKVLDAAFRIGMEEEAPTGSVSVACQALRMAAAFAIDPTRASLEAAVHAEGMTAGSPEGLPARRLRAIATLTRWGASDLRDAMGLVPTGIVKLDLVPDGVEVARDILAAAAEAVETMASGSR